MLLSVDGGVLNVDGSPVNTDDQNLSLSGSLASIDTTIAEPTIIGTTLNIDDGTGVDLGATFATDSELSSVLIPN